MKKLFYTLLTVSIMAGFASCSKEEPGGTAVQNMSGEWRVFVDGIDTEGNIVEEDPWELGLYDLLTYNTNANLSNEMYLDDFGALWGVKIKVDVDCDTRTFWVNDGIMYYDYDDDTEEYYPVHVTVSNGEIVENGGVSLGGYTVDTISYYVQFEDDPYLGVYYDYLWVHGYRKTGLVGGYD